MSNTPWHEGERALQREAGVSDELAVLLGAAIRDHLRTPELLFFPQLAFVVIGTVGPNGSAWTTLQAGAPGFLSTPDEHTLRITRARDDADPAECGLQDGHAVGVLGIELSTRRHHRVNGRLRGVGPQGYEIAVEQSFGNCPRFIRPRQYVFADPPGSPPGERTFLLERLDAHAAALVAAADTLFVASYADLPGGGRHVDVSHRGGPPGFVMVSTDSLIIPDYRGNNYYSTLGNINLSGRAGLLFVDFSTGDVLQITGRATIETTALRQGAAAPAQRSWTVHPDRIVMRRSGVPLRWR